MSSTEPTRGTVQRRLHKPRILIVVAASLATLVIGGSIGTAAALGAFSGMTPCASGHHHAPNIDGSNPCVKDTPDVDQVGDDTIESDSPEPTTPEVPDPTKDQFIVEAKVLNKQCFGSAGCNAEVEPKLTFIGGAEDLPEDRTCDVTIEITGDESGPTTLTAEMDSDGRYTYESSLLSPPSNSTKISAKVQEVSCDSLMSP